MAIKCPTGNLGWVKPEKTNRKSNDSSMTKQLPEILVSFVVEIGFRDGKEKWLWGIVTKVCGRRTYVVNVRTQEFLCRLLLLS